LLHREKKDLEGGIEGAIVAVSVDERLEPIKTTSIYSLYAEQVNNIVRGFKSHCTGIKPDFVFK
jgi:hypothetical protein